jgi:hypothetical protein
MGKKYIIAVAVVLVLWGLFMGYRHHKKKGDSEAHRTKANTRITDMAKKSPRAGLTKIGRALQRYHQDNRSYPSTLMDLYPKYLANKSLLEEIDWHYEPKGINFYLSKTVIVGDRWIVASMDNRLKPQAEKRLMVAAPTPSLRQKEVIKPTDAGPPELLDKQKRAVAREDFLQALGQSRMRVTSVSLPERKEERLIATVQPEVISVVESETSPGVESELGQKYLVWKDKDGVLGFSNVQYPDANRLSIYAIGKWYNVKTPLSKGEQAPSPEEARTAKRKEGPEVIASGLNPSYLVWRDRRGTLGFGNVQYPEKDLASVFQTSRWVSMKRPPVATQTSAKEATGSLKAKSLETLASAFGTRYLVWKDNNGTLGFGNVQYPEKDLASVFQTSRWVSMKRPPAAIQTNVEQDTGLLKAKMLETLAAEFCTGFLVWKDKNGTVGLGNVQYPERNAISHVCVNGSWMPVTN